MKTYNFWNLLSDYKIEIPIIQRDYAQGRNNPKTNEIRKTFIGQIKEALNSESSLHLNFVYGNITDSVFIPLDGQQRLTTLFLLHLYYNTCENNKETLKKFTYKVRPSSADFCQKLVENFPLDKSEIGEKELSEYIINQYWFFDYWQKDPTVKGILTMLDEIHSQCKQEENKWEKLERITFNFLDLKDHSLTDELYVKMNARGVPLTPFENLKAWLIEHIQENNIEIKPFEQNKQWTDLIDSEWTDLFWKYKDEKNMLIDEELMRYFRNTMQFFLVKQIDVNELQNTEDNRKKIALLANGKDTNTNTNEYYYIPNSFYVDNELLTKQNLNDLFNSINLVCKYQDVINNVSDNIFQNFIHNETSYYDKVIYYALFVFLKKYNNTDKNKELKPLLKSWLRVIQNLASNTIIGVVVYKSIINSIDNLSEGCLNIYEYFSKEGIKITGFAQDQVEEEIEKAKQIYNNKEYRDKNGKDWEEKMIEAEKTAFFKGTIRFLFRVDIDKYDWSKFDKKFDKAKEFFNKEGVNDNYKNDCILLRNLISHFTEWDKQIEFITYDNKNDTWKNILKSTNLIEPVNNIFDREIDKKFENWTSTFKNSLKLGHEDLVKSKLLTHIFEKCKLKWNWDSYALYPPRANANWKKYVVGNERNKVFSKLVNNGLIETNQKIGDEDYFWGWDIFFTVDNIKYKWWKGLFICENNKWEAIENVTLDNIENYFKNKK